jgi:hypothetical protein
MHAKDTPQFEHKTANPAVSNEQIRAAAENKNRDGMTASDRLHLLQHLNGFDVHQGIRRATDAQ